MAENKTLKICDCMTIQKAFEKSASYAVSEQAVFAMMTPILTPMRSQSAALVNQMDDSDAVLPFSSNFMNATDATEDDEPYFTKLKGNWFPEGEEVNAFFDSSCIPCGFRLDSVGQLISANFEAFGKSILEHWKTWLLAYLRQLQQLLNFFDMGSQYIDYCALIEFFTNFMCVPDLQRMLSALMALMSKVSFEFGGLLDLILGLIAPLLQPFLSGMVDILTKYIMMIIKPIECIINSIQQMIRKLDYNVLFQNIDSLDKHIGIGRRRGDQVGVGGESTSEAFQELQKIPIVGVHIPDVDARGAYELHKGPGRAFEADFNMMGPAADWIKAENARNQAAVETAAEELSALRRAGPDGSSSRELDRHSKQVDEKKKALADAKDERDLSELGEINKSITGTVTALKSSLFELIGMLKDATTAVEEFFNKLFDELKKIMGEFIGGSGGMASMLMQKMAIVQMISLLASLIKFMQKGLKCKDNEDESVKIDRVKIDSVLSLQGMKAWTDEEGNVHIEEDLEVMTKAIEEAVKAIGTTPSMTGAPGAQKPDRGLAADEPMQKLKSLIEFTGDPVLDTEIARTTEALITPVKVAFKCPLQTTVQQADQVNKWIASLDKE